MSSSYRMMVGSGGSGSSSSSGSITRQRHRLTNSSSTGTATAPRPAVPSTASCSLPLERPSGVRESSIDAGQPKQSEENLLINHVISWKTGWKLSRQQYVTHFLLECLDTRLPVFPGPIRHLLHRSSHP
ncbi:KN motif and ankyrin repeat domain-containing protein 2 [Anopheles sinensis]|uniref:KN motif and ankyrin repeat domain-containing protein 2 n=1 Tax=Anopheles sinensis TaxID=74873 RepID=A0A084VFK9_ANOSI|nr:KN motif and ankyrin repeat domain-containing protein 2 [Anopheles sinensis]